MDIEKMFPGVGGDALENALKQSTLSPELKNIVRSGFDGTSSMEETIDRITDVLTVRLQKTLNEIEKEEKINNLLSRIVNEHHEKEV